jgi:hypothetical protein
VVPDYSTGTVVDLPKLAGVINLQHEQILWFGSQRDDLLHCSALCDLDLHQAIRAVQRSGIVLRMNRIEQLEVVTLGRIDLADAAKKVAVQQEPTWVLAVLFAQLVDDFIQALYCLAQASGIFHRNPFGPSSLVHMLKERVTECVNGEKFANILNLSEKRG